MKKWPWFLWSLLLIIFDQWSKYAVTSTLIPYEPMPVLPMLNFTLAYNTGAAFSFLSSAGDWHYWFFAGFSFVVSLVLIVWLWRSQESFLQSAGISFLLGGAIGNLIDRATTGNVVDFIDVYYQHHHFATFNIADSAICVGAGLLFIDLIFYGARKDV